MNIRGSRTHRTQGGWLLAAFVSLLTAGLGLAQGQLLFSQSLPLAAQQPAPDYIIPDAAELSRMRVRSAAADPAGAAADGERVEYTAFNSQVHVLSRYHGKYVLLLLPDSWLPPSGLTERERRIVLDRADHLFEMNRTLMGAEPEGYGKTTVAVVPTGSGVAGRAWLGQKGIEIAPDTLDTHFRNVGDVAPDVLVHEMAHNFDLFASYLGYGPDAPHGWTRIMGVAGLALIRGSPTDRLRLENPNHGDAATYVADAQATWEACVAGDSARCPYDVNALWAAISLRTFKQHGVSNLPGFFAYLRNWASVNEPPISIHGKEDLHIAALSAAVKADLGCYVDPWKWWASTTLRRSMMAAYGANPHCLDEDRDGFRPFDGDPDDHDPTRHPAAVELANAVDDDGNGVVDDLRLVEAPTGDFPVNFDIAAPAVVEGRLTDGDDDYFMLTIATPSVIRFNLRSTFQVFLAMECMDSVATCDTAFARMGEASVTWVTNVEWPAGRYRFGLVLGPTPGASAPGPYRLEVHSIPKWPWGHTTVSRGAVESAYLLSATTSNAPALAAEPTEIRFWVSGYGFVASTPWMSPASAEWQLPPGADARALLVRAQPFRNNVPVADVTPPAEIPVVGAPTDLAATVAGNAVTFSWNAGLGQLDPSNYEIGLGPTSGSSATTIAATGTGRSQSTTLPTGAFYVRVYALNGSIRSEASNEIRIFVATVAGPTSIDDIYATPFNTTLTVTAPGVLSNDTDNGGGSMTADLISTPASGSLTFNTNGGFTFAPAAGFSGPVTFTYRATNGGGSGAPATVTITVVAQPSVLGPPSNLTASSIVGNTVAIAWTAPQSGVTPTGYVLEGGVSPGQILASMPTGSAATTFTFAAPTGAFYIRVHSQAPGLKSAASNEIPIFVNVPAPPSAPANLLGFVSGSSLGLAWANTSAGGTATGLILDVTGSLGVSMNMPVTDTFSFAGVPSGTYAMSLRAFNSSGVSASSNSVTMTFPGTCSGAPATPTSFVATKNGNVISVSWGLPASGPAPAAYSLIVTGALVANLPVNVRTISGAVPPGTYTLSVVATNPCGVSGATTPQTVTIP